MVELTRIYTKGGDKGKTSLSTGTRVAKYDLRVEAYGTVDEANAVLGMVRLTLGDWPDIDKIIARVQNDMFDLGADLATPLDAELSYEPLRVTEGQVEKLEVDIDHYNARLQPLTSFILPGGSAAATQFHLSRTVVRRAERLTVELGDKVDINPEAIRYLNRLSDLMFVLARICNDDGKSDVLWVPGASHD
ncbi:MAG: cob(I)yrinic acid a,c-diamide adenosyltransferase [Pseudomonadota bacterium]|nr:cob(I)yrinic acid a,c-diamide adenosyltransferase [Pseudomonadota bacterium]